MDTQHSTPYAVECEDLGRVYRSGSFLGKGRQVIALANLTLKIPRGTIFGLLGPNGAGKTTTVRILSTLLTPTSGSAKVLGFDVVRQSSQVRRNIGLILGGERGLYGRLTGKENLCYFGALNHMAPKEADRRAEHLLERLGLAQWKDTPVERYSRGMKQRVHIARGLLTDPPVLLMDEPTMGLDPIGAQELRQYILDLADQEKTILLTTHYMFEADALCSTVAIINKGRLVALGRPTDIKRTFSKVYVIEVTVRQTRPGLVDEIRGFDGVELVGTGEDGALQKLTIEVRIGCDLKNRLIETIGAANIEQILTRDPTLEEAYVSILK